MRFIFQIFMTFLLIFGDFFEARLSHLVEQEYENEIDNLPNFQSNADGIRTGFYFLYVLLSNKFEIIQSYIKLICAKNRGF